MRKETITCDCCQSIITKDITFGSFSCTFVNKNYPDLDKKLNLKEVCTNCQSLIKTAIESVLNKTK